MLRPPDQECPTIVIPCDFLALTHKTISLSLCSSGHLEHLYIDNLNKEQILWLSEVYITILGKNIYL